MANNSSLQKEQKYNQKIYIIQRLSLSSAEAVMAAMLIAFQQLEYFSEIGTFSSHGRKKIMNVGINPHSLTEKIGKKYKNFI